MYGFYLNLIKMTTAYDEIEFTNLPWVEKYRPNTLDDLVSHKEIIKTLSRFIETNTLPHLLFYGPPGTGKTTTILAAAKKMFSERQRSSMVLEMNASDDRGISVVRDSIITFAQTKSLHVDHSAKSNLKLVILDEADAMTKDAQNALRRVIEKYTENVRFCIICNYLSSIIPAIQSRCTRFRFGPLEQNLIMPRIDHVVAKENLTVTECGKVALLTLCGGDMRRVLNVLQSVSMAFPIVDEASVYKCVGQPTPKQMEDILKILLNDTFENCCRKLDKECCANGYALADIITRIHDLIFQLDIPSNVVVCLISALADTEQRLSGGGSDRIQAAGLVAAFIKARRMIAEVAN